MTVPVQLHIEEYAKNFLFLQKRHLTTEEIYSQVTRASLTIAEMNHAPKKDIFRLRHK